MTNEEYMAEAIKEAYDGIKKKDGGPFGCVVVKDGKIIGRGHNQVLANQDPTCHGEMQAIRDACKNLETFDLSGCTLYTSAEPCPMCLGGILWSNITQVYYGCTVDDTDSIGFRDTKFYDCFYGKNSLLKKTELCRKESLKLFDDYKADNENKRY